MVEEDKNLDISIIPIQNGNVLKIANVKCVLKIIVVYIKKGKILKL